jgi:hypothetical protein
MIRLLVSLVFLYVLPQPAAAQQVITIFGEAVPQAPLDPDTKAVNLGVKFYSKQAGTISGIRFYRAAQNPDGYIARLYSASGVRLARVQIPAESGPVPGWQIANFAAPVPILADTTYVAAYYTSNGSYAGDNDGLASGIMNGPLVAPASEPVGGNGVYSYSMRFPDQTYKASNYYVDVLFSPIVETPFLQMSFNPAAPSLTDDAPLGTLVTNVNVAWSDGSPFTGTLGFGPPNNNDNGICVIQDHTIVLGAALPPGDSTQTCTITATQ